MSAQSLRVHSLMTKFTSHIGPSLTHGRARYNFGLSARYFPRSCLPGDQFNLLVSENIKMSHKKKDDQKTKFEFVIFGLATPAGHRVLQ